VLRGPAVSSREGQGDEPRDRGSPRPALRLGALALGDRPAVVASIGLDDLAAEEIAARADAIELRADLTAHPGPEATRAALSRLRATGRPILLTVRAAREGGQLADDRQRLAIYRACLTQADGIDLEIASAALGADLLCSARQRGLLVILSIHDFATTPAREVLLARVAEGVRQGADVVKIATTTDSLAAVRILMEVTLSAPHPVATLGMGRFGALSRIVLPAAGSLLTYGAAHRPTAPGQLPALELLALRDKLWPA